MSHLHAGDCDGLALHDGTDDAAAQHSGMLPKTIMAPLRTHTAAAVSAHASNCMQLLADACVSIA